MTVRVPEFLALSVNFVKASIELRFSCRLLSELPNAMSIENTLLEHYRNVNRDGTIFTHHPFPNSVASPSFATSFSTPSLLLSGAFFQCQTVSGHQRNFCNPPKPCRGHKRPRTKSSSTTSSLSPRPILLVLIFSPLMLHSRRGVPVKRFLQLQRLQDLYHLIHSNILVGV